ncbi:siderophore-interacting protein [soil metagenome]
MLTSPANALLRDDRPAYRPFGATVSRVVEVSPSFRRITFSGVELGHFGTDRLDQRIKILFPIAGVGISDVGTAGDWYGRWRELPDDRRNPFRTYTVRDIRPHERELDVDFVAHGDGGPAARWLTTASTGDAVVIVGPDVRSLTSHIGIDWHPGAATELLLAGDETAAPAICSILESLGGDVRARVFIEVPTSGDVLSVRTDARVEITWLPRNGGESGLDAAVREWLDAHRDLLRSALAHEPQVLEEIDVDVDLLWDSPQEAASGGFYAWVAGESALVKGIRRALVSETGIDRSRVAFMGYWRRGKAEAQQ